MNTFLIYLIPAGFLCLVFVARRKRTEKRSIAFLEQEQKSGLTEPTSLHPIVDPVKCVGCSTCVKACPENNVLGVIHGKAQLIGPTHCIGHGACKTACPMDAITLVFGTEKRGVDIPHIQPSFETNIPGIFIAGELGGMGLIRNAVTQGRQAVESIRKMKGMGQGDMHDLVIVGAGPSGFTASLASMEHKLRFVTLEQETLGGTVSHYPRGKIVMTTPAVLPLVGKMKFKETTKESLLQFWQGVEKQTNLKINYRERVESVVPFEKGFIVKTQKETYRTRAVLLTIGRRGTPRKLGVPGEENSKVVYRLIDAEQYRGQHVLVVGGGDSALEAAVSISEQPGTTVTLSYRSEAFARAKQKNRDKVSQAENQGQIKVLFKSQVRNITDTQVEVDHDGDVLSLRNDAIIVCVGGVLPTPFLKEIGINIETKYGTQ